MIENWVKIFSSNELVQVKLAEDVLKQHQIVSHIVHKPDSVMPMLGEAELFTKPEQAEAAINILKEHRFVMAD